VTWRSAKALFVVRASAYRIRYYAAQDNRVETVNTTLHDILTISLSGGPPRLWLGTIRIASQSAGWGEGFPGGQ
jgi:hypothetical protein